MSVSRTLALISPFLLVACGSSSPSGPSGPNPTPVPGHPVSGIVFYDEDANGVLDPSEVVRLPGVTVSVGGQTGQTEAGGRFTVANVPAGAQSASVQPESLPPYFGAGPPVTVEVPQTQDATSVPATLRTGRNRANVYLAYGDSISAGKGSSDGLGYRARLAEELRAYWGKADVPNGGDPGTKSAQGTGRMPRILAQSRPAYALILYGTNDWNEPSCRSSFPCYTIDSLRIMINHTRGAESHPILGTIPPVNPAYVDRQAAERNEWVVRMNDLVRALAEEEGVPIAEIHGEFMAQPDLTALFEDHVHPNDEGYRLISRAWFRTITSPSSAATASHGAGLPAFFFASFGS